jgi:radical SAM protein with 4Fe4S-binding SPASM domain
MQISMHHYEQEKCNDITQHSNSFNLTLKGIQNAIEIFGHDHVNVNMVVMKDTVSDVSPMGQFLQRHGVYNFSVGMVSTCGEAAKNVLLCEQPDLVNVYNQLAKLAGPMAPAFTGGLPFCGLPKTRDDNKVEMANVCDAGLAQVVIGPEGNIRPCVELPFIGGNIFDDDLGTIWRESEVFNQIRRFENTPVSCRSCTEVAYCHGGCRASALAYTENPLGYDPMTPISRRS